MTARSNNRSLLDVISELVLPLFPHPSANGIKNAMSPIIFMRRWTHEDEKRFRPITFLPLPQTPNVLEADFDVEDDEKERRTTTVVSSLRARRRRRDDRQVQ